MQNRWAVMSAAGEWSRDGNDRVLTFMGEATARAHCDELNAASGGGWTTEEFTVEDALEEATRSPFAGEGGL
jgi:hypothetical protein